MSDFANLKYQKSGAIATLTIDRPKALNALNQATLAEIQSALLDAGSDPAVHGLSDPAMSRLDFRRASSFSNCARAKLLRWIV